MAKFELWMGYFGNGLLVCNKAVMEYGDYKEIAYISPAGNIVYYVSDEYIPAEDKAKIENTASGYREEFEKQLDAEISQHPAQIYAKMLDRMSYTDLRNFLDDCKKLGIEGCAEKARALRSLYLARS